MDYRHKIKVPRFSEAAGHYTTPERSRLMAKIRATDTKAERLLRRQLWGMGYRYRKNVRQLPGKPDLAFAWAKLAVFVDGEFWHGYDWANKKAKLRRNRSFWIAKIERNRQRDLEVNAALNALGYTVLRFWERQVRRQPAQCAARIAALLEQRRRPAPDWSALSTWEHLDTDPPAATS